MQDCKLGAEVMLENEVSGDGIICKDGLGASRRELHQLMLNDILNFLNR